MRMLCLSGASSRPATRGDICSSLSALLDSDHQNTVSRTIITMSCTGLYFGEFLVIDNQQFM